MQAAMAAGHCARSICVTRLHVARKLSKQAGEPFPLVAARTVRLTT